MRLSADLPVGATFWGGSFLYLDYRGLAGCCSATEVVISFFSGCGYFSDFVADSAEGCALGCGEDCVSDSS
jgi:hypothetical protein